MCLATQLCSEGLGIVLKEMNTRGCVLKHWAAESSVFPSGTDAKEHSYGLEKRSVHGEIKAVVTK